MRHLKLAAALLAAALTVQTAQGQLLRNLGNAIKQGTEKKEQPTTPSSQNQQKTVAVPTTTSKATAPANKPSGAVKENNGPVYYVSNAGTARAAGTTADAPAKDIQKILNNIRDNQQDGAIIRVAEGNYLGYMNSGFIEIYNWVTLEGGWNSNFTERNPLKYITRMEPTQEQLGSNGSKGVIQINRALDDVMAKQPKGTLIIDGIFINLGLENYYMPNDPSDPRNGCPSDKFETGRIVDAIPPQVEHQMFHSDGWIAGNVIIRNCLFLNGVYFALQFGSRCGEVEIYNNVILSNRYGGVRIDGGDKNGEASHVNFHHNTVAFAWCREKAMEDMGYGYECMTKVNCDLHHNIFACNNYAAIARTHVLSGPDKPIEAKRKTNIYDNAFFMNTADLQLPPTGGGKWTNVKVENFEDLDESILPKVEGNFELKNGDPFVEAIDKDYLEAFAKLKVVTSSSFNPNSAANQFRSAMGMNMQGSETIRVSMYGNRYNFDKALLFFGAKEGYGAQKP
ncbi:MAG: right-handed parallel beta-helix repeat-containing protein [Paludibacteraceae bacterium]|nr:right-handed parallel beta-helix repeat-containing protein [Paludibacteraceae bacterium]MBQ9706224.1 right-handed parallel beta-helix repeat-containing protein [Paludibacteraceae bacterium]